MRGWNRKSNRQKSKVEQCFRSWIVKQENATYYKPGIGKIVSPKIWTRQIFKPEKVPLLKAAVLHGRYFCAPRCKYWHHFYHNTSANMSLHEAATPGTLAAAKITVAFSGLYGLTFVNILISKKRMSQKAKAEGKTFNRYESKDMQTADRLNGNILEWYPVFMGPLWALAFTGLLDDTCVAVAWTYFGLRVLYAGLILKNGVAQSGINRSLWVSTFPGYACLIFLFIKAMRLFFV